MPGDKILHLKESNKAKLKKWGLETSQNTSRYQITISKPDEVEGNTISLINTIYEEDGPPEFSPMLELKKYDDKWVVEHWEYIPGPGPGDFTLYFDHEDDAIDFVYTYYFTDNEYFTAKALDIKGDRNGIDMDELGGILEKAMQHLKEHFSPNDFIGFETFLYNKIPVDNWKDLDIEFDPPKDVKVEMGGVLHDSRDLKELIMYDRSFESKDFERLSALFMEFANLTRSKADEK